MNSSYKEKEKKRADVQRWRGRRAAWPVRKKKIGNDSGTDLNMGNVILFVLIFSDPSVYAQRRDIKVIEIDFL